MVNQIDVAEAFRRSTTLEKLDLLSHDESQTFDRLARLASRLVGAPVSLVSMVAEDYQWFLGCTGLKEPYATERRTPLSHSFCQYVVASKTPLIISDAREHALVRDNLAIRDLDVIAYLGIPLVTADGVAVGSFCVIDDKPRNWTEEEIESLRELSASVMTEVELRYELEKRREAEALLAEFIREQEQSRIAKEMTASLAHDIRTPLSSIRLRVDMLLESVQDERIHKSLESIQRGVMTIVDLLGDFALLWTPTNLSEHIQEVGFVDTILASAIEHLQQSTVLNMENTEIHIAEIEHNLAINANVQLLTIAIANILENGVIYNHSDAKQLRVVVERTGNTVMIAITDNGDGILATELSQIFEPLFKSNKARSANYSRSGLGLTIARQIIMAHEGSIKVTSNLNTGTTVIITLPLAQ